MKLFQFLVAALLLASSAIVLAEKPDPNLPNPPLATRDANVDGNDWIRVHEQGTAKVDVTNSNLDVTITNNTLDVSGSTVSVDNFPDPQNVFVTDGIVDANILPADAVATPNVSTAAGDTTVVDFATINATTIVIWDNSVTGDNDPEFQLWIRSPLTGGGLFKYAYDEGLETLDMRSFTHPIPVSGVELWCKNESDVCTVGVRVIGYQ
jgi:hypothetical protein